MRLEEHRQERRGEAQLPGAPLGLWPAQDNVPPHRGGVLALLRQLRADEERAAAPLPPVGAFVGGRFRLEEVLGAGGMGRVYAARELRGGREVALKFALRQGSGDPEAEQAALAGLCHPGVVRALGTGRWQGTSFLILERLRGETLADRLTARGGALPEAEALPIALAAAEAVAYLHAEGVIHGDLKPANIFLTEEGEVKLMDFGLAHRPGGGPEREDACGWGTSGFLAPDRQHRAYPDAGDDVWALAATIVVMLTGALPGGGEGPGRGSGAVVRVQGVPVAAAAAQTLGTPPQARAGALYGLLSTLQGLLDAKPPSPP